MNLKEDVFSELTTENFPETEEGFIALTGTAYTNLYRFAQHGNLLSLLEISSDEIVYPLRNGYAGVFQYQWIRVHQHDFRSEDPVFADSWNFLYHGISDCNRLIAILEKQEGNDTATARLTAYFIAELKVLRAWYYYWLLDVFGNIPVVTAFENDGYYPVSNDRAAVFQFVENELIENTPKLIKAARGTTYSRMNYYTGQAMLAKLYLNAEVYTGTARWEDCAAACDEIIHAGIYQLESDYFANFNTHNEASKENIFVIPYDRSQAPGFDLAMWTLHNASQETFHLAIQPLNGFCSLPDFYKSYTDDDRRKGKWGNQKIRGNFIAGPQYRYDGIVPLPDSMADNPDGPPVVFTPEINSLEPDCQRQAGVRIGKFEFATGATQNLDNDFALFRYADVLMMKAESIWRLNENEAEALLLVNLVRQRAGLDELSILTAENLLAERGREFFYEGWRRQDLIRFDRFGEPWQFKPASAPCKTLFPIPKAQLEAGSNLSQNPCY